VFSGLTTTETPQGVITLVRPPEWTLNDVFRPPALAVILDGIQDPGNAGAIVRAAEAFGASGVVFLKGSVNPHNPKCLRASAGSLFRLPAVSGVAEPDLLAGLERTGVRLFAASPRADRPAGRADLTAACAIAVGAEGRGVSPDLAARADHIRIPTTGVESLNAAVATGVLLYEAQRQRSAT
jgi:TrmH family RNA methyltransferase